MIRNRVSLLLLASLVTISGAVYAATGTTSGVDSAVSRLDVKINDGKTVYKDE